ncbi:YqgE/AlgH family protein [Mesobaculum littorinae]|uniref:UPF0301 protein EKE94_10170 n=1 Tax=Mesobaculum littorinae TaxID=2486419 RepID=A0A438AGK3_9RHOB|nr:YqgE/AlgH family protein [Mesobaculum littorinae]RVV97841.1 YqgE/AlgH family protein [Mesobaculum littorinae]
MDDLSSLSDLHGKILIAMPGMGDPRFEHSVIYLCAHSEDGAMGLIVNKPAGDLTFQGLLDQLNIDAGEGAREIQVHFGGPVEHGRGFVLHSGDYAPAAGTLQVDPCYAMTATLDILEAMAQGGGPRQAILALGYAGWGPGQLESEIAQNGWLICDAADGLLFGTDNSGKWQGALNSIGIDPLTLSSAAGHA